MIKALKGTQDVLPSEVKLLNHIEAISRKKFSLYCYKEIRTPIIEESSLFVRSVGADTEIVKKQMYSFKDQGGRDICLRPEETAPVVRSYIEHHLDKTEGLVKFFYIGPMFRSERPQAGRMRQFHQIGVEVIGSYSPYIDAEVIILLDDLLKNYRLSGYTVVINSLGCEKDKKSLKRVLHKELKFNLNTLCDDCKRRYKTNILRILDCKNPTCQRTIKSLSALAESSPCPDCRSEFNKVRDLLDGSGVRYLVSPLLVRGLDYYTKMVFEVVTEDLRAQNALAAGGRYDNLVSDLGGPETGACGFAIGVERVVERISGFSLSKSDNRRDLVFIATMGEEAHRRGFDILRLLREANLSAEIDYQQKSLKAQMRYADRLKAGYVILIGEDELKKNAVVLKDMSDGDQETVALDKLVDVIGG